MNVARFFRFALIFAAVAGVSLFGTGAASAAAPSPPFTQCPHIGFDTSCAILIYIDDNGAQLLTDPSQGPYDNIEDTLIGVLNNTTGTTISSIPITGSGPVFGFDQDGACDPNNPTTPFAPGPPDANSGVGPCTDNSVDTTGYGGPNSFFTNINGAKTAGTVNFIAPLAPGQSTWFSLEEKITGADLNVVTATSVPIGAVEGNPFTGVVANLHATNTSAPASQFTATITWSDDGSTTAGTVTGGSGSFTVSGTHTFVDEGSYTATVTITDTSNGNKTTVTSPATVADAPLTAGTLTLTTGVEGVTPTTATFTFSDANPLATTADFTATIDWGDSSLTAGTVSGGAGSFTVTGSHQYAEEGNHTVTVTVLDDGGSTTGASGSAIVNDAPLSSTCAIAANSPQAFSGATLTFTDANPGGTLSDFTATIDWGDTNVTSGTVSGPSAGVFTVSGSHTYTSTGFFNVTTTVNDVGGSTTSQTCRTLIFAFAPGGGAFVIGDQNSAVDTSVTFWGAQWSKLNSLSGGAAPAAFKGFAPDPAVPACGVNWSSDPGNSSSPPAGPLPDFMAVIVSSSITQSGSDISGDTAHIVIVQTNGGYAPSPGHAGTGKVVAVVC
jgi:PKD repeat protein